MGIVESMGINQETVLEVVLDEGLGLPELSLNPLLQDRSFSRGYTLGLSTIVLGIILEHDCLHKVIRFFTGIERTKMDPPWLG